MARETDACVQPATGPIGAPAPEQSEAVEKERVAVAMARVGKEAPDFEASGFIVGEGFKNVRLSSYRGQWVLLCFYPGDFTFV
jgi:hypothetical protein